MGELWTQLEISDLLSNPFCKCIKNRPIPSKQHSQQGTSAHLTFPRIFTCIFFFFKFSILGLRYDVADDEVKKYYRKQAVLVHPDKASLTVC